MSFDRCADTLAAFMDKNVKLRDLCAFIAIDTIVFKENVTQRCRSSKIIASTHALACFLRPRELFLIFNPLKIWSRNYYVWQESVRSYFKSLPEDPPIEGAWGMTYFEDGFIAREHYNKCTTKKYTVCCDILPLLPMPKGVQHFTRFVVVRFFQQSSRICLLWAV